jgi:hypothetical protein
MRAWLAMKEPRESSGSRRRDHLVEPLFGALGKADEEARHKESAPESVAGPRGASKRAWLWGLVPLAWLLVRWLRS